MMTYSEAEARRVILRLVRAEPGISSSALASKANAELWAMSGADDDRTSDYHALREFVLDLARAGELIAAPGGLLRMPRGFRVYALEDAGRVMLDLEERYRAGGLGPRRPDVPAATVEHIRAELLALVEAEPGIARRPLTETPRGRRSRVAAVLEKLIEAREIEVRREGQAMAHYRVRDEDLL